MQHELELEYEGIDEQEFFDRSDSQISILSGSNNTGKSLILKQLFEKFGDSAHFCGTNRYYEMEYFPVYNEDPNYKRNILKHIKAQINEPRFNRDPIMMTFHDVFIRLTDDERNQVYRTCTQCLGETVQLDYVSPGNSMSNSFLKIGDTPIAKCSSGSRMLIHLVSILFSKRFEYVLVDEPELGLTPRIQDAIQSLLFSNPASTFPHLKHIYIATHSHIFLNRNRVSDNFLIKRNKKKIRIKRLLSYPEFVDLQFNQLGNSFHQLQLPTGFVIIEGKTDGKYIKRLLQIKYPNNRINFTVANGDGEVKNKLYRLLDVIGDIDTSPYNGRILVLVDGVHSPTLVSDLSKMGLNRKGIIEWKENGIEYYYPLSILRTIFKDESLVTSNMNMDKDRISHNGIEKTKNDLCEEVLNRLTGQEELPQEVCEFLSHIGQL